MKLDFLSNEKIRNSGNHVYDYAHSFFRRGFLIQCALLVAVYSPSSCTIEYIILFPLVLTNREGPCVLMFMIQNTRNQCKHTEPHHWSLQGGSYVDYSIVQLDYIISMGQCVELLHNIKWSIVWLYFCEPEDDDTL